MVDPRRCRRWRVRTGLVVPLCGGDIGGLTVGETTVLDMMDVEREQDYAEMTVNVGTECVELVHKEAVDQGSRSL